MAFAGWRWRGFRLNESLRIKPGTRGGSSSSARKGAGTTCWQVGNLATKVDTTEGGWRLAASCVGGRGLNRTVQTGKGGGDGDTEISERP